MTPSHQYHLDGILMFMNAKVTEKYSKGLQQHGGKLWEKKLMPEIIDEVADLLTYVVSLKNQLEVVAIVAEEGFLDDSVVASKARESCKIILELLNGKHSK